MKKTLSIILAVVTLLCVVPYALASVKTFQVNTASGGTLPTSLVSYWNLNGPTGDATDYYGSNNLTNTGSVGYSAGLVGDAGNFTTGEYFKGTSGMLSYAQSQAVSINCWVKRSSTGANITIFGNSDSNVVGYWFSFEINNSLGFYIVDSAGNYISINSAVGNTTTSYQMVTATYSGSGTKAGINIYVNTSNVNNTGNAGSMNGTITSTASPAIGATWNGSSYVYPMMGQIDECGFWTKVLSANEITDLYNGGAGQTMCNGTGGPLCGGKHKILIISLNWKPEPLA